MVDDLSDGVILADILIQVERDFFINTIGNFQIYRRDHQMEEKLQNLNRIKQAVADYYLQTHSIELKNDIDLESILIQKGKTESTIKLFELVLGVVVSCPDKDFYISKFMELDQDDQYNLGSMVERVMAFINGQSDFDDTSDQHINQDPIISQRDNFAMSGGGFSDQLLNKRKLFEASPDKDFDKMEYDHQLQRKDEKIEELYQQMQTIEKDRTRVRATIVKYEEENKNLVNGLEEAKIEITDLKKQIEIYENKLNSNLDVREDKIMTQQSEIKELEGEIDLKNKKIRELLKEKTAAEKRYEEDYQALRDELDVTKEKIIQLSKNEAIIEVYKKKIQDMAQLKSDYKDMQDRNQRLVESLEILEKEKGNNKNLKQYVQYLEEQLNSEKSKYDILEIQSKKNEKKNSDLINEKIKLEKENQFYKETNDQLESELKKANVQVKQAKYDEMREDGGALLPESQKANMREKIKQLEKENSILKMELENKFDKDKAIIQSKLQDALREKEKLEQQNEMTQQQLQRLQEKIINMSIQQDNPGKFEELSEDMDSIMRDRDQYFLKMTQNEIMMKQQTKEVEQLQEQLYEVQRQLQKVQSERTEYHHQYLQEKEKVIIKQEEISKLENELSKLKLSIEQKLASDNIESKESQNLLEEIQRLREQEKLMREELIVLKATTTSTQSTSQHQEIMAQLIKQNEEIQLNAIVSELKLEIKDKENTIKDLQRDLESKDKDYQLQLEKLKLEVQSKEQNMKRLSEDKNKEIGLHKETGLNSKRLLDNIRKEQSIMSGVFHNIAMELFQKQLSS
ncbi:UNKNOWN [Stylonychia lemnae]|uniref:HOOK N-terminal domain-containing protein n=1 Tax=Stylonychia lemnae TaxID=5949 RepID=A0A078BAT3_STYLE|nr:UNKNOWN [Stylonychia lemnae]|eukprot:CDW90673.1 UNKNOWN [Stylonychia lemnae]